MSKRIRRYMPRLHQSRPGTVRCYIGAGSYIDLWWKGLIGFDAAIGDVMVRFEVCRV